MNQQMYQAKSNIHMLELSLMRGKGPAFAASVSELYDLFGLLDRSHAILSLLYHTNDAALHDARKTVVNQGMLTPEVLSIVTSLYPLDFLSLRNQSPLKLSLLPVKDV